MEQEGMLPDFMKETDWDAFDMISVTPEQMVRYEEYIGKFFMTHTKGELYDWAIEKRAMLYPVLNSEDLLKIHLSDYYLPCALLKPETCSWA